MNPLVFWNELAEVPLAPDVASGAARMDELVDALGAVSRAVTGLPQPRLWTQTPLDGIELAPGYTVASWRAKADQPRQVLLLKLGASSPIERGVDDQRARESYECIECRVDGVPGLGVRAAYAADHLATSLRSHARWDAAQLDVEVDRLTEEGSLESETGVVRHVASVEHVAAHRAWLSDRLRCAVTDGADLIARRATLCPRIEFGRDVEADLRQLDAGSSRLRHVLRILFELEDAFAKWDGSAIYQDFIPRKCTSNTPLPFARANGDTHHFKWHVRYTAPEGAGRVFFDGDHTNRTGFVGFIGLKKDVA